MKVKLLKRLLLLALCCLCALSLASCSTDGGSERLLSKEELLANITDAKEAKVDFVLDYFDKWDLPLFSTSKIKKVETLYRKNFYKKLPDALTHAREAATLFVENYYGTDAIDLADKAQVEEALIACYVSCVGDRYSYYRSPEEYESYSENMSGSFVGIGVTVTESKEPAAIKVVEVTGDAAREAGILEGDLIIAVDGERVADVGYTAAVNAVKGEAGTTVTLTVMRNGIELTATATRAKIIDRSVTYSITDGIGYVKITSFKSNTAKQFDEALEALEKAEVKGVIYDLRSNRGGYLSAVEDMLDRIAPKGVTLVSFTNDYAKDFVSTSQKSFLLPSVVLCNGQTASAGELFTAGVRDLADMGHLSATVVGTTSYGKGVMQRTFTFSDGSAVTMTVAYYNPPSGQNYDGVGIVPHVYVEMSDEGDVQLDTAYDEILKIVNNN